MRRALAFRVYLKVLKGVKCPIYGVQDQSMPGYPSADRVIDLHLHTDVDFPLTWRPDLVALRMPSTAEFGRHHVTRLIH